MQPDLNYKHSVPPNSYSRELDSTVQAEEMPYGYTASPPPADTGDFNQQRLESKKHYYPYKKN
jgi:hypothetical protein